MVAKHRMFSWLDSVSLPANVVIVFGRSDDFFMGVAQCKFHGVWSLLQGTRLETRPRYTPTTCFETFPFPRPTAAQQAAIDTTAKELNELRERWLQPPEWTETCTLEFLGTVGGPWDYFIDRGTTRDCGGFHVGTVRYPRLEPRNVECAPKLKKRTLTNLYNERPTWLDDAHRKLDAAVARAYGWEDFARIIEKTADGIVYDFGTESFGILETTPEGLEAATKKFQKDFDEQILERLLALNLERAAEEEKAAKSKKPKGSRGKQDDELL